MPLVTAGPFRNRKMPKNWAPPLPMPVLTNIFAGSG